jgi:hypothetical protein
VAGAGGEGEGTFTLTHLYKSDEDDEEGRRAAGVVVSVVLPISLLGEKLVADHAHHPGGTTKRSTGYYY